MNGPTAFKDFKFDLLASDDAKGTFEGYGNVSGVLDSYGDIIEPGAGVRTLQHWEASGTPIPMLFQHDMFQPIGGYPKASEDSKGLRCQGAFLLDIERARDTYSLVKTRVIHHLSIGWSDVASWEEVKSDEEGRKRYIRHVTEYRLWEISPCLWGANDPSVIDSVKGAVRYLKAGWPFPSSDKAHVERAIECLQALLDQAKSGPGPANQPGGSGNHPPASEIAWGGPDSLKNLVALQKTAVSNL